VSQSLKAVVWADKGAGWIFCQRPQAASFLAARSAAAQEPRDQLVDARGRLQIDEARSARRRDLLADRQRSACRPDEVNDVGVDLDPRCGHHQRSGQASWLADTRALNHLFTWRRLAEPRALATAGSGRLPLRDEPLCVQNL
jgi:hypothetical protein